MKLQNIFKINNNRWLPPHLLLAALIALVLFFGGQINFVLGGATSPVSTLLAPVSRLQAMSPNLLISEFLAANNTILADEDGTFSDWIEISNPTNSSVNLAGWQLQDSSDLWTFPQHTLAPGDSVIVWASGKDRAISGQALHTNFKLSAGGEYLGLIAADGTIVSEFSPAYPSQVADVSYGLDGSGQLVSFVNPTPGASNSGPIVTAPVIFSVPHGFYETTQIVALSSATSSSTVRYTLDNSNPTAASTLYTSPLSVNGSTIIRARAFSSSGVESKSTTQTYLFMNDVLAQDSSPPSGWPTSPVNSQVFDYGFTQSIVAANPTSVRNSLQSIPSLSLVTDLDNLFDPATGIYVNAQQRGEAWERPGSLELIDPSGTEAGFTVNTGIRIRGGSSRSSTNPKHSFRLFFRGEYGDSKLTYPLFGDEGGNEFDKLDLRTDQGFSWAWDTGSRRDYFFHSTYIRELWSRDTQGALGQPYTRSRYYHLYINGQYFGIFQTEERITAEFGETYLGGDQDDYDVIKVDVQAGKRIVASNGTVDDWRSLWPLVSDEFITASEFALIESEVDLTSLIDYYIIHFFTGDVDNAPSWYNNPAYGLSANWFGIRNRIDGKWEFLDHDSEHSLCSTRSPSNGVNTNVTPPWPTGADELGERWDVEHFHIGWLHLALTTNDNYVQLFRDRVQLHLLNADGLLQPAANIARFNERVNQVDPAIHANSVRWGDSQTGIPAHTKADWDAEIDSIVNDCFGQRNPILMAQLAEDGLMPTLTPPTATQIGGSVAYGASISLNHTNGSGTIYYTTDGSDPRGLNDLPTAMATSGSTPTITDYQTVVTARVRNGGEWSAPFTAQYLVGSSSYPTTLIVNEYNAVDQGDGTWTGTDSLFAGDPRNGGDWIEFAVVDDMDLRGWSIELWDRDRDSKKLKRTDKFVFSNASFLSNLKAGTLFTISEDHAEDLTYDPAMNWDWSFNIQASNLTTSALLTAESNTNFNVNHRDFRIVIRNAAGHIVTPIAMGETESWDAANGNVSPSEMMMLCTPPTATINADADYVDESISSTFGEPNLCFGLPQDLTALRGILGDVNCDGSVNVVDALFVMQFEVQLRTDNGACPLGDPTTTINTKVGNVNRDSGVNVIDALFIMQCEVSIANAFCPQ